MVIYTCICKYVNDVGERGHRHAMVDVIDRHHQVMRMMMQMMMMMMMIVILYLSCRHPCCRGYVGFTPVVALRQAAM